MKSFKPNSNKDADSTYSKKEERKIAESIQRSKVAVITLIIVLK